ncbi:MAG: helix-turn-helix transcriptional regulator [Clostridia bacterium]|nr:helix-turn-helix transcriptional regulator [Clostridia bacterium]
MHRITPENLIHITGIYTVYDAVFSEDYYFDGERHNFWELIYVKKGKCGVTADDTANILSSGQAMLIAPDKFHKNWTDNENAEVMIFSFSATGHILNSCTSGIYIFSEEMQQIASMLMNTGKKWLKLSADDNILFEENKNIPSGTSQIFADFLEILILKMLEQTPLKQKNTSTQLFSDAVNYMQENITQSISLEDVAKALSVSKSTLKQMFKKYTGIGIKQYFNDMKIEYAKVLLKEKHTASEVSAMLSYSSQNYFSTAFKKHTGVSPLEYKQKGM